MAHTTYPEAFVTVTHGVRGWFSVLMVMDEELGCPVPWNSGFYSYASKEEAEPDAALWAEAEALPFIP